VPFLRVVHDKRGYETSYLMELYRDGHRQRSQILYVFRTPSGVRGGREALDADMRREIEAQFPAITFNWKEIRENQQHIEMAAEPRRRRPRREEAPLADSPPPSAEVPSVATDSAPEGLSPARPPLVPSAIEGATPDEQMAFLSQWYPAILERIPRRTSEPARQEALTALCERLNPAAWTDADQITSGLQRAAEALERLSRVFAKRRRRRRRRVEAPPGHEAPPSAS
jgi:hypothetical protein